MEQIESYAEKEEPREELKERRQIQRDLRQQEFETRATAVIIGISLILKCERLFISIYHPQA